MKSPFIKVPLSPIRVHTGGLLQESLGRPFRIWIIVVQHCMYLSICLGVRYWGRQSPCPALPGPREGISLPCHCFLVFLTGCCLRVSNKLTAEASPELALPFILVMTVCSFISRDLNRAQPVSPCLSCALQSLTLMSCAVLPSLCLFLCWFVAEEKWGDWSSVKYQGI